MCAFQVVVVPAPPPRSNQRTPGVGADALASNKDEIDNNAGGGGGRITEVMELAYVTERIIALWYREDTRGVFEHATSLLKSKHANNYLVSPFFTPGVIHTYGAISVICRGRGGEYFSRFEIVILKLITFTIYITWGGVMGFIYFHAVWWTIYHGNELLFLIL